MADEQDPSNDVGDGGDASEIDYEDSSSTAAGNNLPTTSSLSDYYDENEPIEDYVVKMVVNEQPDGPISPDLVQAYVTDIDGNVIGTKPTIYDSLNGFTSTVFNELSENGTSVTGTDGKRWWGKFIEQKLGKKEEEGERKRRIQAYVSVCKCVYAFATSKDNQ